eukprot:5231812-Amphidinium_carterae.1
MDEGLGAASLDLQAAAASPNHGLGVGVVPSRHHHGGAPGQHGDLQKVPVPLRFGREGAVQEQLVRCVLDGVFILLHCRQDDLAVCIALLCSMF